MRFVSFVLNVIIVILVMYLLYRWFNPQKSGKDTYVRFDDPKLDELKQRLITAFPEMRNIDLSGSNRSFTINKRHVYICTKDARGQYYHDNMLIYVLLHELAHVMCDEVGHTEKYKKIFQGLLHRAHEAGLYDPDIPPVDDYCNY